MSNFSKDLLEQRKTSAPSRAPSTGAGGSTAASTGRQPAADPVSGVHKTIAVLFACILLLAALTIYLAYSKHVQSQEISDLRDSLNTLTTQYMELAGPQSHPEPQSEVAPPVQPPVTAPPRAAIPPPGSLPLPPETRREIPSKPVAEGKEPSAYTSGIITGSKKEPVKAQPSTAQQPSAQAQPQPAPQAAAATPGKDLPTQVFSRKNSPFSDIYTDGVVLADGSRIPVGSTLKSGERIVTVSVKSGVVITDRRVIQLQKE